MAKNNISSKKKVPAVAGFDKGPKDFFRGSLGFGGKKPFGAGVQPVRRDFMGFRRGSK